jgi:hypothetical protein
MDDSHIILREFLKAPEKEASFSISFKQNTDSVWTKIFKMSKVNVLFITEPGYEWIQKKIEALLPETFAVNNGYDVKADVAILLTSAGLPDMANWGAVYEHAVENLQTKHLTWDEFAANYQVKGVLYLYTDKNQFKRLWDSLRTGTGRTGTGFFVGSLETQTKKSAFINTNASYDFVQFITGVCELCVKQNLL